MTTGGSAGSAAAARAVLLRRGRLLESITLGWNVVGIVVLAVAAVRARSVALAGFGLDSLIEIGASMVVLWELSGTSSERQRRALRLIGGAFLALAGYLTAQSVIVLAIGYHPGRSPLGIAWTAITAAAMFALATGKARTGRQLDNPVLTTEGRVTMVDGILALAVLAGLLLNAAAGLWWADPLAALVIVCYAVGEAREIFLPQRQAGSRDLCRSDGEVTCPRAPGERCGAARSAPGQAIGIDPATSERVETFPTSRQVEQLEIAETFRQGWIDDQVVSLRFETEGGPH